MCQGPKPQHYFMFHPCFIWMKLLLTHLNWQHFLDENNISRCFSSSDLMQAKRGWAMPVWNKIVTPFSCSLVSVYFLRGWTHERKLKSSSLFFDSHNVSSVHGERSAMCHCSGELRPHMEYRDKVMERWNWGIISFWSKGGDLSHQESSFIKLCPAQC